MQLSAFAVSRLRPKGFSMTTRANGLVQRIVQDAIVRSDLDEEHVGMLGGPPIPAAHHRLGCGFPCEAAQEFAAA